MKRDSIFYKLFQQSPTLVFEILSQTPENAERYRFDSVAVKEPRFEIDGVLLPPEGSVGTVFFVEVQFQKDEKLYERIFAETALYFYRNYEKFCDWQVVVIYPSRSKEQDRLYPHRSLLEGNQLHRRYLDELGEIRDLPIWVALMVLTTVKESAAADEARYLINRTQKEVPKATARAIIEIITTIISYRFKQLNLKEVEAMLDITFEETRVYRELKAEAEQKGRQEGLQEGRQEGRQEEAANLVTRMLVKRFGNLEDSVQGSIAGLPLESLEDLSEAILDFDNLTELYEWLENCSD